jgi:hypothetical protein
MKVVDAAGGSLAGTRCITFEVPPHPFQLQYPELVVDQDGTIDLTFLDEGTRYTLRTKEGPKRMTEFVCRSGGTIVFQ